MMPYPAPQISMPRVLFVLYPAQLVITLIIPMATVDFALANVLHVTDPAYLVVLLVIQATS